MSDYRERNARIVERHLGGETFAAIGDDYGISRQRVQQIVRRAGVTPEESRDARKVEWKCEGCGAAGRRTPCHAKARFCSQACRFEHDPPSVQFERQYTDDELLIALQDLAVRLGYTPGNDDIIADRRTPSHVTYYRRFGSLRDAQEAAGLTPNDVGPWGGGKPLPDWLLETA